MFRFSQRLCAALLFVFALSAVFSPSVYAVEHSGLGGKPAHPNPADPRTQSWFIIKADPGVSVRDEVLIVNSSDQTKEVKLYPADTVPASGGGFALKQEGDQMKQVGNWAKLEQTALVLKPGERKTVGFTLQVPGTTAPGEYTGGIMVQEKAPPVQTSNGMSLSVRMGIRIYVTVSGEIHKSLVLDAVTGVPEGREIAVNLPIRNTGNASVDLLEGEVLLTSPRTNTIVHRLPMSGFQILQDSPFIFSSKLPRPTEPGDYLLSARVVYKNETDQRVELQATSTMVSIPVPEVPGTLTTTTIVTATSTPADMGDLKNTIKVAMVSVGGAGILIGGSIGIPLGKRLHRSSLELLATVPPKKSRSRKRSKK